MRKRLPALLPVLLLALCTAFSGCVINTSPSEVTAENTVTDGSGAVLAIPENREELTIASVYAVAAPFFVALDLSDRVVAVNVKSIFWTDAVKPLAQAGTMGRGAVDLEALAGLDPDVLVHRSNDKTTVEAVQGKLGIPVFCITVESVADIKETLRTMGLYFGAEERAREVADWLDGKFDLIGEIVAQIPREQRVTALVLGGEPGRVAGGDMLQSWMIGQAGGICLAAAVADNRNWTNVGVETVFEWNPDMLFLTSSTVLDYTADTLRADPTWSGMSAVQSGSIHQIPAKIDSWDMPGISCALGTMYMLHKMYPDFFSAGQLEREIDEYYTFLFGKTFERDYLGYNPED
ncbi:MAG: ABC transporter substrate-binding protein [Gracilibacteraceae bacterium]|jgi:ABC-type Fe3+-hydroxamate transport system substrate-binding protein|nr:ABC transporter substrate-binding protein [Gracilibacteraceae bacterium]